MARKTAEARRERERIEEYEARCWAEYLKDTRNLKGYAYDVQEDASWKRLKSGKATARVWRRLADLEDTHG